MYKRNSFMDELADYIKRNLKKGYTKDSMRWALKDQGYTRIQIEKALKRSDEELAKEAPPIEKPVIRRQVIEPLDYSNIQPEPESFLDKIWRVIRGR